MFERIKIFFVVGLLLFLTSPFAVLAVGYGEGTYGNDVYPSSGLTPAPQPSNNNNPPACDKSVTPNVPDLFEIRASKNSMLLYFSPPNGEYSSFYIAFSRDSKNWEYGAEYNQNYYPGVLRFTVNLLNPNTSYYVKIRPGNGCATGNWSNVMKATTTSLDKEKVFYRYTKLTKVTQSIKSVISKIVPNKNTKTETAIVEPTVAPKAAEQKMENKSESTEKPAEKKKFCIWKWCF